MSSVTAPARSPSIRGFVLRLLGATVWLTGMVVLIDGVWHIIKIGTCGSRGTFVAVRPCPPATTQWILFTVVGAIATILGSFTDFALFGLMFVIGGLVPIAALHQHVVSSSGGAPYLVYGLGGLFIVIGVVALAVRFILPLRNRSRLVGRVETRGTIVAVEPTSVMINNCPRVRLQIRVEPRDLPAYVASKTVTVSVAQMPRIGQNVAVWYDPKDPQQVSLGLASNLQMQQAIDAGTLPTAAGGTISVPVTPPMSAAPDTAEADETIDRLERLTRLRDSGSLTADEFETQKHRLLGGPSS